MDVVLSKESVVAFLKAVEDFFGPDYYDDKSERLAALVSAGRSVRDQVNKQIETPLVKKRD